MNASEDGRGCVCVDGTTLGRPNCRLSRESRDCYDGNEARRPWSLRGDRDHPPGPGRHEAFRDLPAAHDRARGGVPVLRRGDSLYYMWYCLVVMSAGIEVKNLKVPGSSPDEDTSA